VKAEKALQTKKEEYRNETDEFLKGNCKQKIQSLTARSAGGCLSGLTLVVTLLFVEKGF